MSNPNKKKYFQTPAWHWTLHWPESRFLPGQGRKLAASGSRAAFRWDVTLAEGFSLSPSQSYRAGTRRELKIQERRMAVMTPAAARSAQVWEALAHNFSKPFAVRLHLDKRSKKGRFWILLTEGSRPLAYGQRSIDFELGSVEHEYFVFVPTAKGKGRVAQVLANAAAVYKHLGIAKVTLTAGLTAGSGVWPRLGFSPATPEAWATLREVVRQNAKGLAQSVRDAFAATYQRSLDDAIDTILADDDPLAIFELVDIDPDSQAGKAAGLQFGIVGELLSGGHWRGVLEFGGAGGTRLDDYLRMHHVQSPLP